MKARLREVGLIALHDIATEADIKILVDRFYDKVNADPLLGPIFNELAKVDWDHHLPTMYSFWSTLLFRTMTFKGQPLAKHLPLPLSPDHFRRWLKLFTETINENFTGAKADEAKGFAASIADTFQMRMGIHPLQKSSLLLTGAPPAEK